MKGDTPKNTKHYQQLAFKLLNGTISASERGELEEWYNYSEAESIHIPNSFAPEESELYHRLLGKIRAKIGSEQKGKIKPIRIWKTIGWAAAAMFILMGSLFFFLNKKENVRKQLVAQSAETLAPGGNKALLTLADGTQVILDSAGTGNLAHQGDVTVIKLNDGQIAYNETKKGSAEILFNTISTPAGGQYQLILSDATKVWLNAKSSLRFPASFAGDERRVTLTGEGYFEVAPDKRMPFFVKAGGVSIKVLGTHFNVSAYSDEEIIRTTLAEGSVQVIDNDMTAQLTPGQQAQWKPVNDKIRIIKHVDLEEVLAWKNGYFQFNEAGIQTILKEAARWYDADIVYEGRIEETFSGRMPRSENIAQLLKILEATSKVEFQIIGKQIIVKPK